MLKRLHARHKTVVSICTGAFELARAGLLDGKPATTHHWYFGAMTRDFPDVHLVHDVRWVRADPTTWTAGGLTSGVDLALHLVAERFGEAQAERTANFMEYLGQGWKSNVGIAALSVPIKRQLWTGTIAPDTQVLLHVLTTGASDSFTVDIPARHVNGAPAIVHSDKTASTCDWRWRAIRLPSTATAIRTAARSRARSRRMAYPRH